jgi:hypothetical protein
MKVKCLELRDRMTFIPVICLRPVPTNEAQRYLLQRDGYRLGSFTSPVCLETTRRSSRPGCKET